MEKGDTVFVIKTFKGEIINKLFESADKAMEYAKENGYLPCILITGAIFYVHYRPGFWHFNDGDYRRPGGETYPGLVRGREEKHEKQSRYKTGLFH